MFHVEPVGTLAPPTRGRGPVDKFAAGCKFSSLAPAGACVASTTAGLVGHRNAAARSLAERAQAPGRDPPTRTRSHAAVEQGAFQI